jgi:hypothetical protein
VRLLVVEQIARLSKAAWISSFSVLASGDLAVVWAGVLFFVFSGRGVVSLSGTDKGDGAGAIRFSSTAEGEMLLVMKEWKTYVRRHG